MRALIRIAVLFLLAASASGCAWCFDQCLGTPKTVIEREGRRETTDCDLLPGSLYVAPSGHRLDFGAETVEWRHDGVTEVFDYRCRKGWIQFRDGGLASDALLRPYGELEWIGVVYRLETNR